MGAGMAEGSLKPGFGKDVSRPRAGRWVRVIVYLLLLALACGAIWFIDRGATLTNLPAGG